MINKALKDKRVWKIKHKHYFNLNFMKNSEFWYAVQGQVNTQSLRIIYLAFEYNYLIQYQAQIENIFTNVLNIFDK